MEILSHQMIQLPGAINTARVFSLIPSTKALGHDPLLVVMLRPNTSQND